MRTGSGGSQWRRIRMVSRTIRQRRIVIAPDRLVLDLDVLHGRIIMPVHRCPSCDMVTSRAILWRLSKNSSSVIHSCADARG
eukprot:8125727-Pyramimonas_sp.AAC.1